MSNLAKYSPYNRSFQFMHLQNSAYHLRNKQQVKSLVKTNLKKASKSENPQQPSKYSKENQRYTRQSRCQSAFLNRSDGNSHNHIEFAEPHRIIHKHEIMQRAKSARISQQNIKMVKKLINTECLILNKPVAEELFKKQCKYRSLRRRYQDTGERNLTPLGNLKLLNPTLFTYKRHNLTNSRKNNLGEDNSVIEWLQ